MFPEETVHVARAVLDGCRDRGLHLATAESMSGGLVGACLTSISGASDVVVAALVTYTDAMKRELLGVPADLLEDHGAVSREVAGAMVTGALARTGADVAVAVTGYAEAGDAVPAGQVGLVHVAAGHAGARARVEEHRFTGDRGQVRLQAVQAALVLTRDVVGA